MAYYSAMLEVDLYYAISMRSSFYMCLLPIHRKFCQNTLKFAKTNIKGYYALYKVMLLCGPGVSYYINETLSVPYFFP